MAMRLFVTYIPCAKFLKEQTGDIITFTQFEEGGLSSKTRKYAEINENIGDKSNDGSIIPPLLILEEMDAMDYGSYTSQPY